MNDPGKTQRISAVQMRELIERCRETHDGRPPLSVRTEVVHNPTGRPSLKVELETAGEEGQDDGR